MGALALDRIQRWVLVTGVIRSGTTFLGKVLSLPASVDYIHEPFNGGSTLPDRSALIPRYYRFQREDDEARSYRARLAKLLAYQIDLNTTLHEDDPWHIKQVKRFVGSRGPVYLRLARSNPFHRACVIKDPLGKVVAEHLHVRFGVRPVIIVRHPVALAASLKRMQWWPGPHDFDDADLIEDYLPGESEFIRRTWQDPLLRSAAHWRVSYKMLLAQAQKYPGWEVVTHEELGAEPVAVTRRLYQALDLPFSPRVERKVIQMTQGNGSAKASGGRAMDLKRNSADIFRVSRDALSKAERRAIFDVVEDVALDLYSRASFALD